ncbi:MAG: hypothetical protein LIR35_06905 [Bacteroidota bacterium]|nr:hypothetical protein [Bacteroidota bacterium]
MKRFLLVLAIVSLVAMSSCVNRGHKKVTGMEPTEFDCSSDIFVGDARSREAVDFYSCRIAGLKISDIIPDVDGLKPHSEIDYYGVSRYSAIRFVKDDEITEEDKEAYVRKVYEACKAVADGNKCIYGFERSDNKSVADSELTLERLVEMTDFSEPGVGFSYKRNGKYVLAEVYFNDEDRFLAVSVSPGMAMSLEETIKAAEGSDEK